MFLTWIYALSHYLASLQKVAKYLSDTKYDSVILLHLITHKIMRIFYLDMKSPHTWTHSLFSPPSSQPLNFLAFLDEIFLLWSSPLHIPPSNSFFNTSLNIISSGQALLTLLAESQGLLFCTFLLLCTEIFLVTYWPPHTPIPAKTGSYLKTRAALNQSYILAQGRSSCAECIYAKYISHSDLCFSFGQHLVVFNHLIFWTFKTDVSRILILSVFFPLLGFRRWVLHQWCEW